MPTFVEAVSALEKVSDSNPGNRILEFKNFVENFGTHFSRTTILGVRIVSERRFSAKERANRDDEELKVSELVSKVASLPTIVGSNPTC